jgi:hypothetical protein
MRLYLFEVDGRYLAFESEKNPIPIIGAFNLATDGNYYTNICIAANKKQEKMRLGAEGWLEWLKEALEKGWVKMSKDFSFDINQVRIEVFRNGP